MRPRLAAIAAMVRPGCILADIGTDHAHLCISLVQTKRIAKAYACDIAPGPLRFARAEIERAQLQDRIFPILSDGFAQVPADADGAVIAGMGFHTAAHILEEAVDCLWKFSPLIVQINDDPIRMRSWLSEQGFFIVDEAYVSDRGKDYSIVSFDARKKGQYTETECVLGPVLMRKNEPAYRAYCQRRRLQLAHILALRHDMRKETLRLSSVMEILTAFLENGASL